MAQTDLITRYDSVAPKWGARISSLGYTQVYRGLIDQLDFNHTPKRICDVGAGSGTFSNAAISKFHHLDHLTLIEPSAAMLGQACQHLETKTDALEYHQQTLEQFTPTEPFDLTLGAHVIEHCPDPALALRKLFAITADGGALLLVISKPHWCQWLIWLRWRHRWYSKSAIFALATQADLPEPQVFQFSAGPPQRTSLGYIFRKPKGTNPCISQS